MTGRLAACVAGACASLAWLAPAAALAQAPGTSVGGTVSSFLELALSTPATLAKFPAKAGVSEATITATITATNSPVELSIADGDATAKPGYLAAGSHVLADPLEATVGTSPFQALDLPIDPLLMQWKTVLASQKALIRLRQNATAAAVGAGPYAKTLLITVSTETP
jgi:hypothetical protein